MFVPSYTSVIQTNLGNFVLVMADEPANNGATTN